MSYQAQSPKPPGFKSLNRGIASQHRLRWHYLWLLMAVLVMFSFWEPNSVGPALAGTPEPTVAPQDAGPFTTFLPLITNSGEADAAPVIQAAVTINNPPGNSPTLSPSIIVFPQRDFVSASGYANDDLVIVRVIHDPAIYPGATGAVTDLIAPQGDPADPPGAFAGIVEVNHPGGACWVGQTPDIRPGDRVQIEVMSGTNVGRIDETTVQNITAQRPVQTAPNTVVVHGTAQDSFSAIPGNPLDIALLEQRIVAPGSLFELNGRRTLRATSVAGSDGTLAYDPISPTNPNGINWTATYSGLSAADVTLAVGAESRGMWLGNAVPPALETTVYEIGALTVAGPAAPCTAPLEVLPPPPGSELEPPTAPTNLTASVDFANTVTLNWTASTDNVGVTAYGIYRNDVAIFTVSNPNGSAPAPTTFVDRNTPPGTYTFQVRAFDAVGNASDLSNIAGPITAVQQVDANTFPVNDPPSLPINIIAFPSRDFISPSGYLSDDTVTVQLLRSDPNGNKVIISTATGIIPIDGFAEVNHPGGACWEGVTPEIRAGDIVRTIAYNPANIGPGNPDGIRSIDQTRIAGVTAFKPVIVQNDNINTAQNEGIVEVHGTALGADGLPLPLDQIEQRMIATRDRFDFNGRRAMRAAANSDGTLTYDTINNPMGIKWTARYEGLDADDVARMAGGTSLSTGRVFPGADTRIHWLGRDPLLLNEATIFENAPDGNPPGPAGPACTRPLEAADETAPTTPGSFNATQTGPNQVSLSWTPSTDDWYVAGYRIYQDSVAIANTGPLATGHVLNNVTPGGHDYFVRAYDTASPRGPGADIIAQISSGLGNLYGNLSQSTATVSRGQADVTAPSVPTNLVAQSGAGFADLSWTASTDDIGVTEYGVYRDGNLIATVPAPTTSYHDDDNGANLTAGAYVYTVDAADAALNRSAQSAPATANVTAVADTEAPTIPTNVVAVTTPDIHGRTIVVFWTASTDNVGVTGYGIYRNGVLIASVNGTTLSFSNANLATGTYSYTVDAFDSAGNRSAQSSPPSTAVVANDPPLAPHSLIAFPARDFISATGYTPGATYFFTLIRGGQIYLSAPFQADATGTIEVNHPDGTCWNINTPDMRPGDVIRITDAAGVADQTTVANVTADRPSAINATTVVIHGTAQDALGNPLPLAQIEQRLISSSANAFDLNGRRALRAASAAADGTLAYDAPGSTKWTATYTGLSANDVLRAVGGTSPTGTVFVGAESRAHWLGRDPLALVEATIFENGVGVVGGPSAPCTAPAETPAVGATFAPVSINFPNTQFSPVRLTSVPQTVTFSNGGGAAMTLTNIYIAGLNPGDFARAGGTCPTVFPAPLAAGASCTVNLTFSPAALGLRQANLSFSDNAANTTDQTIPLTGSGFNNANPTISVTPANVAFGTVNGGASTTQTVTVRNTAAAGANPLTISAATIGGANAADFTITGNTCINNPLAAGGVATCTITLQFKPGARTARAATLTLTHNAAPIATSTAIALSGTGGNGSVLTFSTNNPVQFGTVNRNTTKDQTITVKNSGNQAATLNLTSFTVTGTGYSTVSTTCANLAANGSCNIIVRFTAPNVVNTFNGTLSVFAANGFPTTVTINLAATTR
ncbi:MAG: choice-of-anchor D domain-containing protein [Anaerolineae bacterium]